MAATVHTQNKSVVYKAMQAVLVVRIQWVIFLGMIFERNGTNYCSLHANGAQSSSTRNRIR